MAFEAAVIMRTGLREYPSWPGGHSEVGYVEAD